MPSADEQLDFLNRLCRVLNEGRFTTTYKFALIVALSNLAVRRGTDGQEAVEIQLEEIAAEFIDLHWGMAKPFPGAAGRLLRFTTIPGRQASVIRAVAKCASTSRAAHARSQRYKSQEARLKAAILRTLTRDVLYRLQNVNATGASAPPDAQFIYGHPQSAAACARLSKIVLKPGVSACLRALRPVIVPLTQAKWAAWVREKNPSLGPDRNIEQFMFGGQRASISHLRKWLYEFQGGRCFYTSSRLRGPDSGQIDHFLPWARYPLDLPANLVLASASANGDKRDWIASERHLATWAMRNEGIEFPIQFADQMPLQAARGDDVAGRESAKAVARWLYSIAERGGLQTWDAPKEFVSIAGKWRRILGAPVA